MIIFLKKINKAIKIICTFDIRLIKALFKGVACGVEHEKFFKQIKNLNTIIDVGCNKGQFALFANYSFPKSTIYSFDPLSNVEKIYKSSLGNSGNCFFYPYAIGSNNVESIINVSNRDDSSSLLANTKKQTTIYPGTQTVTTQKIEIKKLNNCLQTHNFKSPTLLKIDVQGFELECLKGAEECLDLVEYIYVECSYVILYENQALADEIIKWLENKNFKLIDRYNFSYDDKGNLVQADFFFQKYLN
jgi:FkbM family methyltransferase